MKEVFSGLYDYKDLLWCCKMVNNLFLRRRPTLITAEKMAQLTRLTEDGHKESALLRDGKWKVELANDS